MLSRERQSPENWVPLGTGVHLPVRVSAPFNATQADRVTTRLRHRLVGSPESVRLLFANWYNNGGRDTPGRNPIVVSASFEATGHAVRDLSFEGCPTLTLQPGEAAMSDAIHLGGPASGCTTMTAVEPCDGTQIPLGPEVDTTGGEYARSWSPAPLGGVALRHGFGPSQILGIPGAGVHLAPCVVLAGDSNGVGFGDRRGSAEHWGWAGRLFDARGPFVNVSTSGATAQGALSTDAEIRRGQLLAAAEPGSAVVALGTNDLQRGGPLAPVKAALSQFWQHWATRGWRVVAATIPPVTDSQDGWASVRRQTPAPGHRERLELNDWIRGCPAPVDEVWDLAAVVEVHPHLWRPGMTLDGVHLSPLGHAAVAAHLSPLLE